MKDCRTQQGGFLSAVMCWKCCGQLIEHLSPPFPADPIRSVFCFDFQIPLLMRFSYVLALFASNGTGRTGPRGLCRTRPGLPRSGQTKGSDLYRCGANRSVTRSIASVTAIERRWQLLTVSTILLDHTDLMPHRGGKKRVSRPNPQDRTNSQ